MKKNILIITNSLDLGGGAERIATEVGNNLDDNIFNVTFLTRYNSEISYEYNRKYIYLYDYRSKDYNIINRLKREINTSKKIANICNKENINIIISFSELPNFCAILSKIIFKNNRVNIILSERNNPLQCRKLFLLQKKILYPKADKVVALSKGVEELLKTHFSLKNTTFIHNIQNFKKFRQYGSDSILKEHEHLFNNDFIFITIGRSVQQKGQWHLLRCFKKINQSANNTKLIIFGNGPLQKNLMNLTKKINLENSVYFLGYVKNVFPYLKKSHCFVLTSLWEGFGNVLTEALSQDIPVISTDCKSGPREILAPGLMLDEEIEYPYYGKYGILINPFKDEIHYNTLKEKPLTNEEDTFAQVMLKMIQNKKLVDKYRNGSERGNDFKPETIIPKWEDLLKKY